MRQVFFLGGGVKGFEKADLKEFFYMKQEVGESCNVALQVSTKKPVKITEKRERKYG
jgi:hypothetical protein